MISRIVWSQVPNKVIWIPFFQWTNSCCRLGPSVQPLPALSSSCSKLQSYRYSVGLFDDRTCIDCHATNHMVGRWSTSSSVPHIGPGSGGYVGVTPPGCSVGTWYAYHILPICLHTRSILIPSLFNHLHSPESP